MKIGKTPSRKNRTIPGIRKFVNGVSFKKVTGISSVDPFGEVIKLKPPNSALML